MEYITEARGGWDEWSDKYEIILGVRINGKEFDRFLKEKFTNKDGNLLRVDFPRRNEIGSEITIEQHDPEYKQWKVESLNEFEDIVDVSTMKIDVSDLSQVH